MTTVLDKELPLKLNDTYRRLRRNVSLLKQTIETGQKPLKELYEQFESLGDVCEFAGLQRANGVERCALFNWRATTVPMLIAAIESKLEGVDKLENLRIEEGASPHRRRQEYYLRHAVFQTVSHTFVHVHESDPETVLKREHRNLILLKRKFLEDLAAARRIYVFRSRERVEPAEAKALAATLRTFGDNTLLWVSLADEPRQVGRVTRVAPGLLHGRIDALPPLERGMDSLSTHWPGILSKALRLRQDERGRCFEGAP